MNKKNTRKGFTIVELVIVIAVIAILATVLVPTFGGIIEKANNSKIEQTLRNEYTEYTIKAGASVQEKIYVLYESKYYEVTNGVPNLDSASENAPTTEGDVIWTGDDYTVVEADETPNPSESTGNEGGQG